MSSATTLQATNISVGFTKTAVVSAQELSVEAGEIVVIAGPNGVGKSTIVKALARQLKPLSGQVTLGGMDVWTLTPALFANKVAYVPQSLEPGQDFTVEEIVMLGRNPHQKWWQWFNSEADKIAVDSALSATEMVEHRKKYLSQLSGGERQRACLATALAQEPSLMILDEPTAHLDFKHQLELATQLKELKKRNIGCLIVLHDLNLISRVADKVVLLGPEQQGPSTVKSMGSPDMVLSRESLAAIFEVDVHIIQDPSTGQTIYHPVERVTK